MTDLTRSAEQAVLGALVADPGRAIALNGLTVSAFGDGKHQAIFAALTGAVPAGTGLLGRFRGWLTRLPLRRQIRDLRAYMDTLPGLCPDPDHIADYAAMLGQARKRHDEGIQAGQDTVAGQVIPVTRDSAASQLQASQAWLDQAATRAARRLRAGPASRQAGLPRAVERLAAALAAPDRTARQVPPGQPVPAEPAAAAPVAAAYAARPAEQGDAAAAVKSETLSTGDLQDLVFAGLLQHPREGAAVTAWLPADVFATGRRQWLYQAICDRIVAGRPVDPLIIAWHASARAVAAGPAASPEEIQRLGTLPAVPGTAVVLGRALLAEHVCARQFGPDWPESLLAVQPDTGQALAVGTEPVPGADHDLAPAAQPGPQLVPASVADPGVPVVVRHGFGQDDASTRQVPLIQRPYGEQAGPQPVPRM